MALVKMDTLFKFKNSDKVIHYDNDDIGKFLNVGDYVEIFYDGTYKVCSRTYDLYTCVWTLILERCKDKESNND